ncbi:hypothetical protein FisN_1Hh239 [Fistulifera solaris]|uniref:ADP,ATP carrier protein n=1 Tax=Fistulifera solaris TaxID=1519565 RepID=A0A1Z5JE81_FISSO|nr:hypothetical protein FisN_1Hh239 [Fistulifera solaris]|eukprot:GAX12307.1 hypothetical protein FisN_1Hh239 [Fistulifera solaris]
MQKLLPIPRGGAALGVASSAIQLASSFSSDTQLAPEKGLFGLTPEGKAVLFMAIAMSFHYLGYSLARPVTVALFTSASSGYAGVAGAFPFAMAFVSPLSLLLLMGYTHVLDKHGARRTMIQTTSFCSVAIALSAVLIAYCHHFQIMYRGIPLVKFITAPLFVFREAYVQLLTSQYWSFMASILNPSQSEKWFGPIAGLTSLTSALSGFLVTPVVQRVGLSGALMGTAVTLIISSLLSSSAYDVARKYGFEPKDTTESSRPKAKTPSKSSHGVGTIEKMVSLFGRVPLLRLLFFEVLASQAMATILNISFVAALSTAIPNDTKRAGYVGVFFSAINLLTMFIQFGALPSLIQSIEARDLWRAMPVLTFLFTSFQATQKNPSLAIVSASFLVMKVTEYSVRRLLDEMLFVPLDFESRFLGKELIGVFGYRFGKSLMSLVLSALTSSMGNIGLQETSILSSFVSIAWLRIAWELGSNVPTREEAERSFVSTRKPKK